MQRKDNNRTEEEQKEKKRGKDEEKKRPATMCGGELVFSLAHAAIDTGDSTKTALTNNSTLGAAHLTVVHVRGGEASRAEADRLR